MVGVLFQTEVDVVAAVTANPAEGRIVAHGVAPCVTVAIRTHQMVMEAALLASIQHGHAGDASIPEALPVPGRIPHDRNGTSESIGCLILYAGAPVSLVPAPPRTKDRS